MKKLITLALLIILLNCKEKSEYSPISKEQVKTSVSTDNFEKDKEALKLLNSDSAIVKKTNKKSTPKKKKPISPNTIYISADEYTSEADLYLKMKQGKVYKVERKNEVKQTNFKSSINKKRYSTEGIEYSEDWRIKAYKATEEYLIRKFPTDNKGCRITNVGYYRPHNVKYIGSHSFQVKIYIIFKCNNDSYRHKKNLWMEAYYWDDDNSFGFSLIKDRYVD